MLFKSIGEKLLQKSCKLLKLNNFTYFFATPSCTYATKESKRQEIEKCAALIEKFLKLKTSHPALLNKRNDYCTKSNEGEEEELCLEKEARHNYHEDIEQAINKQIILEFSAAYSYLAVSCHFGSTSVGLLGTQQFFKKMSDEEVNHAMKLIKYQQIRGGNVQLTPVPVKSCPDCSIVKSLKLALSMEKAVLDILLELLMLARKHQDIRTEDFIISDFLKEQLQCIRNVGNLIATATRMKEGGVDQFLLDKELSTAVGHTITKI